MTAIILISARLFGQENRKVIGTVGKEKMIEDQLVICEFGTQACMPIAIDPRMKKIVNGKVLSPIDFQVGWYVEALVGVDANGRSFVKEIEIDPRKTIICLRSMNKKEAVELEKQLRAKKGIEKVKTYPKSKQVLIEYEPKIINYKAIEQTIVQAGYEVE